MIDHINVDDWTSQNVCDWLAGINVNSNWLQKDKLIEHNIRGKQLLLMTPYDLTELGATKVDVQEQVLAAIEKLQFYQTTVARETLQTLILRLACQSRSLQRELFSLKSNTSKQLSNKKNVVLSPEFNSANMMPTKQRVSLETLARVSNMVTTVKNITNILSKSPYSNHDVYRSMKSLLLALSVELTSTAQRDQFVDQPNDVIEKSSKTLADYCDRIVVNTKDPLLIQTFRLETVEMKWRNSEFDSGFKLNSTPDDSHVIDRMSPLSLAKKNNKLDEGDEVVQFNNCIIGWSAESVQRLVKNVSVGDEVVLTVKKRPSGD